MILLTCCHPLSGSSLSVCARKGGWSHSASQSRLVGRARVEERDILDRDREEPTCLSSWGVYGEEEMEGGREAAMCSGLDPTTQA